VLPLLLWLLCALLSLLALGLLLRLLLVPFDIRRFVSKHLALLV
jgi:hypothetical protein